jgi:Icc-related predicted phosphoesterase
MIYAASDLHGNLLDPPSDATGLILAGDICPDFIAEFFSRKHTIDYGEARQANWLDTAFREWLGHGIPTIGIWGNHDFIGEHPHLIPDLPWTLLQDNETEFHGRRVWGTPWVPGLPRWAFYASKAALTVRADSIPEGLDILVSHGPPHRAGDYIGTSEKQRNKYGNYGGINAGDIDLTAGIRRAKPKVTICGHIHEARGRHWLSGNRVLNVAAVNEIYEVHDDPWTRVAFDEEPYRS